MTFQAAPDLSPLRLLAMDTSTDRMSVAVGSGAPGSQPLAHDGPGAAQSSATLLPVVSDLLGRQGWDLHGLDAIVFARGPGSFTGLRTACAVAQGLAYGAQAHGRAGGVPVLPVDSLLAVVEEARVARAMAGEPMPQLIVALLDARMGEMYVAAYACDAEGMRADPVAGPCLCAPGHLAGFLGGIAGALDAGTLLAGNVFDAYSAELAGVPGQRQVAWPTATALLRLAPALLARGGAVNARDAMPLYVRDKVAQTTDERERLRLDRLAGASAPQA